MPKIRHVFLISPRKSDSVLKTNQQKNEVNCLDSAFALYYSPAIPELPLWDADRQIISRRSHVACVIQHPELIQSSRRVSERATSEQKTFVAPCSRGRRKP